LGISEPGETGFVAALLGAAILAPTGPEISKYHEPTAAYGYTGAHHPYPLE
jgi:hypothetical protein